MHKFYVGRLKDGQISPELASRMFRMRHRIFRERLGWDVCSVAGLERDEFDDATTVYVIAKNLNSGEVDASWRLRPTTERYMLRDTFPQLLYRKDAPADEKIWEVSRFAVSTMCKDDRSYGFTELTQDLVARTVEFGLTKEIRSFVWVCSAGVERLALRLGYRPRRFGPPLHIGSVLSVAAELPIDALTCEIALRRLNEQPLQVAA